MEVEKSERVEIRVKSGGKKRGSGTRGRSNLRIKTIKNASDNYQFSLSTDDKKNVNIIVDRCESGKIALFNKIKSCLARTEDGCGIDLELSGEADCDMDDIFVGESEGLAVYGHEDILKCINGSWFAEDALANIVRRANRMLQGIHGVFDREWDCYD